MGRCSVMVVLFLLGCGHVLGGSSGGDLGGLGGRLASVPDGTSVKMLFTVGVRRGVVTRVGEGRRRFEFSLSDVVSVVGFTDRPVRYAFSMTMPMLGEVWSAGKDSFSKDPPNAVIRDSRSRIGVTEVTGLVVDGDSVTFELDRMSYRSLDAGDSLDGEVEGVTLFIDSSWLKVTGSGIAFGLQQAAKACVSVDCEFWPRGG